MFLIEKIVCLILCDFSFSFQQHNNYQIIHQESRHNPVSYTKHSNYNVLPGPNKKNSVVETNTNANFNNNKTKVAQNANLFINTNNGTAKAFYSLAQKCAQKVKDKFGITLVPEVQLVNLPPFH